MPSLLQTQKSQNRVALPEKNSKCVLAIGLRLIYRT